MSPRWLLAMLLAGTLVGAAAPSVAAQNAPAGETAVTVVAVTPLVARLREALEERGGLTASFRQINRWAALGEQDTSRGTLTILPPQRFRLEYEQPAGHLVGCDGRFIWTYIPEERQVLRATLGETTGWGEFFYRGLDAPQDSLAAVRSDPRWGAVGHVALRPLPEWGLRELHVEIAVADALPVGYGYVDEEGNDVRFLFETVKLTSEIAETLFRFTVPDGHELFDAGR